MYDLAISAVTFDTLLVAELSERLAPNLDSRPYWSGDRAPSGAETDGVEQDRPLEHEVLRESSRVALVLHQRLWGHDHATHADEALLRQRARSRPRSIHVIAVDDAPVPEWMAAFPTCSLADVGVAGAAEFALNALSVGGRARRSSPAAVAAAPESSWRDAPQFLAQSRALSSLKREIDALGAELEPLVRVERDRRGDKSVQLHAWPQRLVVQIANVGLTFSWMAGRSGTVADGRLLVIEWDGIVTHSRGLGVSSTATAIRERLYRPEAAGPDLWRWRAEGPDGGAYSTANLARQWFAGAQMDAANAPEDAAASL